MWKPVTVACVALFALSANASSAEACSCVLDVPPTQGLSQAETAEHFRKAYRAHVRKQFEESYAIFSAEAIALAPDRITFLVQDVWKGDLPGELSMKGFPDLAVYPRETISSCDYFFSAGKKYLVVAYGSSLETMTTKPCTATGELFGNGAIATLDELVPVRLKPRERGASFFQS
jgi:hypothetical protein